MLRARPSPGPGPGPVRAVCSVQRPEVCPLLPKQIGKDNFVSRRSPSEGLCSVELAQSALMHELLCSIESLALS